VAVGEEREGVARDLVQEGIAVAAEEGHRCRQAGSRMLEGRPNAPERHGRRPVGRDGAVSRVTAR
jgi:hypothetical protein